MVPRSYHHNSSVINGINGCNKQNLFKETDRCFQRNRINRMLINRFTISDTMHRNHPTNNL
ncbi:hypothetical protein CS542_09665 [Pedobacter sp. IW39]|nr:hypothetical protein CS542_09665 [Pedobacter sp. IW39]